MLTRYLRVQKCRPVTFFAFRILRWTRTALLPFRKPITNAMLNLGGTLDMCGYGLALNDLPEVQHLSGDINHEEQRQLGA